MYSKLGDQLWADYNKYLQDQWNNESPVYVPDELQQKIKDHTGFFATPIGPIGECIISDQLRRNIPQSFAASYIVTCEEDSKMLHDLISSHGSPQPTILIVHSKDAMYSTMDSNEIVLNEVAANLKNETPLIANLIIDSFSSTEGTYIL